MNVFKDNVTEEDLETLISKNNFIIKVLQHLNIEAEQKLSEIRSQEYKETLNEIENHNRELFKELFEK